MVAKKLKPKLLKLKSWVNGDQKAYIKPVTKTGEAQHHPIGDPKPKSKSDYAHIHMP